MQLNYDENTGILLSIKKNTFAICSAIERLFWAAQNAHHWKSSVSTSGMSKLCVIAVAGSGCLSECCAEGCEPATELSGKEDWA
jgi:hypothetical protein